MKSYLPSLLVLGLAACAPTGAPTPPATDPLAVRYEVRVGQAALTNVTGVAIAGPDLALIEVRIPGGPTQLAPGNMGPVRLEVRADWTLTDRTVETWRQSLTGTSVEQPLRPVSETVTVVITPAAGGQGASYTFQRCLPTEHQMALDAQEERARQVWRMVCQSAARS